MKLEITATEAPARGVTICKDCEFAERGGLKFSLASYSLSHVGKEEIPGHYLGPDYPTPTGHCLNSDAPVSEYVHGFKYCGDINKGDCQFFVKSKP